MPRGRPSQQQQQQNFSASALHQLQQQQALAQQLLMSSPPQQHQQQHHQQQNFNNNARAESLVQRSQGVIFLTSNKPQTTLAPQQPTLAHQQQQLLQQQQHHAPLAAHQQSSTSAFQSQQNMPTYVPAQIMQNPFFPYYHPVPQVAPVAVAPSAQQSNDLYVPNGAVNYEENYMQAPPPPIKPKAKRRSRRRAMSSSSDDSSSDEFVDDEEDPDWNPNANPEEIPEPIIQESPGRRGGRRVSTTNSTPRGGRGRGRGNGRGRGRGARGGRGYQSEPFQNHSMLSMPSLTNQQTIPNQISARGRQTRSSLTGFSMPSLEPQQGANDMSIGELVSAAVRSLHEDQDESYSRQGLKQKGNQIYAAKLHKQTNFYSVEKIPVNAGISMFVYVDTSQRPIARQKKDDMGLDGEDEDLIMSYEIIQEDDKNSSFLCEGCGHPSKSRILHNRHLVTHDDAFRFACCVCSLLFSSHDMLKPHLRTHHGKGIFVCPDPECEGIFQARKSLDDHEFACHPDARPFICRFCFDRFPTTDEASAHEESHPEEISADCMKCGEEFTQKSLLKQHYSDMHEEKQCQYCEEKLENKPALEDHQQEKHAELIKPPTPEPPPPESPIAVEDDDDPTYSPPPAGDGDDEDDIVVVEERKRPLRPRRSNLKKPTENKTPEPKKTVKFKDWKASQDADAAESPPISKVSPEPGPSKPRAGPASSKAKTKSPASSSKKTPAKPLASRPSPLKPPVSLPSDDDVIILSSDDEKDPGWKPSPSKRQRQPPTRKPRASSSRKQTEYVIVVESSNEEAGVGGTSATKSQALTFVVGDSGELSHVPSSSADSQSSESLPMKEIMEIIKKRNLAENTTIVIEDDKISSVQSTDVYNKSNDSSSKSRKSTTDSSATWVRPEPQTTDNGIRSKRSEPVVGKTSIVAKKRTGGIPRSSNIESNLSSPSSFTEKSKSAPGRFAKKRTGGTKSIYDKIDNLNRVSDHRRKEKLVPNNVGNEEVLTLSDDDDQPVFIVETSSIITPRTAPAIPSTSKKARRQEDPLRDPLADDMDDDTPIFIVETPGIIKPRAPSQNFKIPPPPPVNVTKGKRGRKSKSSKSWSQSPEDDDNWEMSVSRNKNAKSSPVIPIDYEGAPKRSMRIALKASVSESNLNEDAEPELLDTNDMYVPSTSSTNRSSSSTSKRGRPSNVNRNGINPMPGSSKNSSMAGSQSSTTNSEGQIVMKALVNGKWQDVVIGTKLPSEDNGSSVAETPLPYMTNLANSNSRNSGGRNRKQTNPGSGPRGGKRSGGGRKGRKNNKKAAAPSTDYWRDDRYQYFSGAPQSQQAYPIPESAYDDYGGATVETYQEEGDAGGEILPFSLSLSSYMDYHNSVQPTEEPSPIDDQDEDGGVPVILNAYHVDSGKTSIVAEEPVEAPYQNSFTNDDGDDQNEEMTMGDPLEDPLAMDTNDAIETTYEPIQQILPPQPEQEEQEKEVEDEDEEDEEEEETGRVIPMVPPPKVLAPQKGTVQEATSALSTLRDVLGRVKINFGGK